MMSRNKYEVAIKALRSELLNLYGRQTQPMLSARRKAIDEDIEATRDAIHILEEIGKDK